MRLRWAATATSLAPHECSRTRRGLGRRARSRRAANAAVASAARALSVRVGARLRARHTEAASRATRAFPARIGVSSPGEPVIAHSSNLAARRVISDRRRSGRARSNQTEITGVTRQATKSLPPTAPGHARDQPTPGTYPSIARLYRAFCTELVGAGLGFRRRPDDEARRALAVPVRHLVAHEQHD